MYELDTLPHKVSTSWSCFYQVFRWKSLMSSRIYYYEQCQLSLEDQFETMPFVLCFFITVVSASSISPATGH